MSGAFVSVHGFDQALPPPPEIQVRGCSTAPWDRDGKSSAASRIALALGEPRRRANTTFRRSMVAMGREGRHGPSCRGARLSSISARRSSSPCSAAVRRSSWTATAGVRAGVLPRGEEGTGAGAAAAWRKGGSWSLNHSGLGRVGRGGHHRAKGAAHSHCRLGRKEQRDAMLCTVAALREGVEHVDISMPCII
jgi:hypothetical protein